MRIGVDFGGTKIEAAAVADDGEILARVREANPGDYDAALKTVASVVEAVEQKVGRKFAHVGVGAPGSVSPATGLMRNANSTWLNGRPFPQDLAAALGRKVRSTNDANCLAISEAAPDGAAAGAHVTFAAILGTGCGGGVAIDGQVVDGRNGVGGEWGHIPLPWPRPDEYPGPRCWCGLDGCLELWISGTGLREDYARVTGDKPTGDVIVARALGGDPQAVGSLDRYVDRLARAFAVVVNIIDPDAFVLGGGMSNTPGLPERLAPLIQKYAFTDSFTTPIVKALHGDSSGVRGAAWLWPPE
jgi:fructokinase